MLFALALSSSFFVWSGSLEAADAGAPRIDAGAGPSSKTTDAGRADAAPPSANMEGPTDELPQGHPPAHNHDPHAGGEGGPDPNAIPPDESEADPKLPDGSIAITIVDVAGKPMPGVEVTLGIIENTIAKGESRKRVAAKSGADGVARFDHQSAQSSFAYRVSVVRDGATFALMPFRLPDHGGQRGLLHVLPVTNSLDVALVVAQTGLFFEVKDDRIQFEQAIAFYNFGKTAWVPTDLQVSLPAGFTAFTAQQAMTDVGVDATPTGYRVRGTFTPGRHDVSFKFQLPYDADPSVRFSVGLPPHVALARVVSGTGGSTRLQVEGFPEATEQTDAQGQKARITEKEARREDPPLTTLKIAVTDIPEPGLPRRIVQSLVWLLGGLIVFYALYLAVLSIRREGDGKAARKGPSKAEGARDRQALLQELEDLERARQTGDVGPKTYAKAKHELMLALARTFA